MGRGRGWGGVGWGGMGWVREDGGKKRRGGKRWAWGEKKPGQVRGWGCSRGSRSTHTHCVQHGRPPEGCLPLPSRPLALPLSLLCPSPLVLVEFGLVFTTPTPTPP